MCHMTFADESAITTHYDTARAPSRGRPRKSPLVCEVRGIKFADSSNKPRHLKGQCTAFYLQALCDVSVAIATKVYAKIDFAIFLRCSTWSADAWPNTRQVRVTSVARSLWIDPCVHRIVNVAHQCEVCDSTLVYVIGEL